MTIGWRGLHLLVGWGLAHLRHRSRLVAALFEPPRLRAGEGAPE